MSTSDQRSFVRTVTAYVGAHDQLFATQAAARISLLSSDLSDAYNAAMREDYPNCDDVHSFESVMEAFCDHREMFQSMLDLAADINEGKKP